MTTGKSLDNFLHKYDIVGYGDYYPRTHTGRLIMVLATFFGLFLVSMTIVSLQVLKRYEKSDLTVTLHHLYL